VAVGEHCQEWPSKDHRAVVRARSQLGAAVAVQEVVRSRHWVEVSSRPSDGQAEVPEVLHTRGVRRS